jgi:branched-chain amino acid transport system substrate-binding protein
MCVARIATAIALMFGLIGAHPIGARADETIKIGVIAPLTGPGAPWGLVTAEGPRIVASEVNAKGGLEIGGKQYKIEVIAYDDQYKAADSVAAYNRLVTQDGVKFVFIMHSAGTMALKQNVEDDKILALTSAGTSKSIDAASNDMFLLYSIAPNYDPPFFAWLKDNITERKIVILNPNDETGWDQTRLAASLLKQNGFTLIGTEMFERSVKDFQPLLTKVMGMNPDIIDLGSTSPASAGLIVRQARELGYKGKIIKSSGPSAREIVAAAGKDAAEGMINLLYVDSNKDGYRRLADIYRKTYGQDPNEMIVTFYDAANVLVRAIQESGDPNDTAKVAAAFAKALPMTSVQGDTLRLGGKTTWGIDHQITTVDYIGVIKNGEPVVVGKVQ